MECHAQSGSFFFEYSRVKYIPEIKSFQQWAQLIVATPKNYPYKYFCALLTARIFLLQKVKNEYRRQEDHLFYDKGQ
jgi:hypothetical protein